MTLLKSPWTLIILAGIFEVVWAICLKYTEGFTRIIPSLLTAFFLGLSMYLLALGSKSLPISIAYPVWVGIGALGTSILGIAMLGEPFGLSKAIFLIMIIAGVLGLKLF